MSSQSVNRQINIYINEGDAAKAYDRLTNQNVKLTKSVNKNQEELTKLEKQLNSFTGAKSSKEFKELKNAVDLKRASVEKDTTTMKLNNQEMDRIQKKIKGELSPSLSDLRKRLSQVTAEFNKMSKEDGGFDEKRKELLELQNQLNEHNASIGKTNNAYKALSEGSGDFMDRMRDFRDGNFAAAFDGLGESMKGMLASLRAFILSPIGATITLLAGLALATKEWLSYNNEIAKLNAYIEQLTGSSGKLTDNYREMATAVEDVFGKDFKETVLELDNLVKDFGISADEAFKIYTDGMIRGGTANSEFGESIREYGQLFALNGYSAQEFVNILNAGIDLQIYNDKLPDAIKEAGLSLTEQTKATKDAMVNAFGAQFTDEILSKVKSGEMTVAQALTNISAKAKDVNLNQQQLAQLTADMFRGAGEDAGGAKKIFEALNMSIRDAGREYSVLEAAIAKSVTLSYELEQAQTQALKSDRAKEFSQMWSNSWKEIQIVFYKALDKVSEFYMNYLHWGQEANAKMVISFSRIPVVINALVADGLQYFSNLFKYVKTGGRLMVDVFTADIDGIRKGLKDLDNLTLSSGVNNTRKALEETARQQNSKLKDIFKEREALVEQYKIENPDTAPGVSTNNSKTPTGKLRQSQAYRFKPSFSSGPAQGAESTFLLGNHLTTEQLNEKIAEYKIFLDSLKARQGEFDLFQRENRAKRTRDLSDDYAVQVDKINYKYDAEIAKAQGNAELIKQIEAEKNEALLQAQIEYNDRVKQTDDLAWQEKVEKVAGYVAMAGQMLQGFSSIMANLSQGELNREQRESERKKREYKRLLDTKRISQEKYNELIEKEEAETTKKQGAIKRKQFEVERMAKLAQIAMDTAVAIMKVKGQTGIGATFLVPAIIASGLMQAGIVASQPTPQFKSGGVLDPNGPSHAQGGYKVYNPQTGMIEAELERGEPYMVMSNAFRENNADIIPSILAASRKGTRLYDELPAFNTPIPRINTTRALESIQFANGGIIPGTNPQPNTTTLSTNNNSANNIDGLATLNNNLVQLLGNIDSKILPTNHELLAKNVAEYLKKYGVLK